MSGSWIHADWPASDNIVAGSTTRTGGISEGDYESLNLGAHVGDDAKSVAENRRRFLEMCGLPSEPAWLNQVHGTTVYVPGDNTVPEADAAIGRRAGDTVAVLTADCLPILLCSADGNEIAALHCGWRGLAAGIVAATVMRLQTAPAKLIAWLGPAISQPAFEVGSEVRAVFVALDARAETCFEANERGRWQADLYALGRQHLQAAGVDAIYGGGSCTFAESERFFSYRRGGQCGRMATFIHRRR